MSYYKATPKSGKRELELNGTSYVTWRFFAENIDDAEAWVNEHLSFCSGWIIEEVA